MFRVEFIVIYNERKKIMPKKSFTAEEVSELLKSPYIVSINTDQITYT